MYARNPLIEFSKLRRLIFHFAVFADGPFDILAIVSYGAVAILELGVFCLVPILNPAHKRRMTAKILADEEALAGEGLSPAATRLQMDERVDTFSTMVGAEAGKGRDSRDAEERPRGVLGWMDEGVGRSEERRA